MGQIDAWRMSQTAALRNRTRDTILSADGLMGLAENGMAGLNDAEFAERMRTVQRDRNIALANVDRIRRRSGSGRCDHVRAHRCLHQFHARSHSRRRRAISRNYLRSVADRVIEYDDRLIITGSEKRPASAGYDQRESGYQSGHWYSGMARPTG